MKQTKQKILDTSIHLIAKCGYANFTLGFLTQYMNISKGVVNYHFPEKDMVFDAIIHTYKESIHACKDMDEFLDFVFTHQDFYRCAREILLNCRDQAGRRVYDTIETQFFDNPYQQGALDAGCINKMGNGFDSDEALKQEIRQMLISVKGG